MKGFKVMDYKQSNTIFLGHDNLLDGEEFEDALEIAQKYQSADDPVSEDSGGYFAQETKANMDAYTLKSLLFDEPWVYTYVNIVARKISKQIMSTHFARVVDEVLVDTPKAGHPLMKNIIAPNQFELYHGFMYRLASELTLMGNAIVWKMSSGEYMLLPTERVNLGFDEGRTVSHYELFIDPIVLGMPQQTALKIPVEDIMHIRLPNVSSVYWGLSPFIPARKSILFDRYSTEYMLDFYNKQTNPGTVIEMSKEANEKQALRFLKTLEVNWTGRKNQRRTMIMPKGTSAKSIAQSFAEQELRHHVLLKREEVRAILNIPPHELGMQDSGSIGSDETRRHLVNFWESTIIPFEGFISDGFNLAHKKELGKKFFFKFDNHNVAILQDDLISKATVAEKMLKTHTINEVRKKLYNDPPVENGDTVEGTAPEPEPIMIEPGAEVPPPPAEEEESEEKKALKVFSDLFSDLIDITPSEVHDISFYKNCVTTEVRKAKSKWFAVANTRGSRKSLNEDMNKFFGKLTDIIVGDAAKSKDAEGALLKIFKNEVPQAGRQLLKNNMKKS